MAVNISEVRLLAVPFQKDYKNTAYFDSATAQANYFLGKEKMGTTNVSYIKDNAFTYPADYDDLQEVNYVMYKNKAYTDKWFYAFITDKERLNDGATRVHIETDSIQTYMCGDNKYEVGYCFVEREHVTDDTIGVHTVPEGLETGEYKGDGSVNSGFLSDTTIVVGATIDIKNYEGQPGDWNLTREFKPLYGAYYDGIYSGISYFVVKNPAWLADTLQNVAYEGQEDAIQTIFIAPKHFLNYDRTDTTACTPLERHLLETKSTPIQKDWTPFTKPTTLDGYEPKNKKLLTYPYCYLLVDNSGGCAVPYHYEKFMDNEITFSINGVVSPGMSIRAIPRRYNGLAFNRSEGINLAKYPTCSWNTDSYTSWLSKNGINVAMNVAAGGAMIAGGVAAAPATGGASLMAALTSGGAVASGASMIGNSLLSSYQHAQLPPQLHGNTNSGDVQAAMENIDFFAYKMSIKKEYARIIDRYFTMYGYRVNAFKKPHKNHRQYFWYTKTVDATITGDIPQKDLQTIKDCYDRGITFWKNPDNIGKIDPANGNPITL